MNIQYKRTALKKMPFIIEGSQAGTVSLVKNEKPFVTVKFDTPVFGLWSCKSKMFHLYV